MTFTEDKFAKHMLPITGSAIREIFHLLGKPGIISFAGGNPSNAALEPDVIAELARDVLSEHGTKILQYGATEGFAPLKESIAEFVKGAGVTAAPNEVLPVQGSQQALDLLLKALIDPGDVVLVENPTFLGALQAMRMYQARPVAIPTDEKGVIVDAAEEAIKAYNPKLIYVIPTFQNPTGVTLSLERREALARLAARYGVILAEDDPYRDLR
jgi:2-aminoadipate transaminase